VAETEFDVAVIGGGLVGAAAALALAQASFSVALIDRSEPVIQRGELGFDARTVALNPASLALIQELGVVLPRHPFVRMVVWEEAGTRWIEFHAEEVGKSSLGAIVEVSPAVVALWQVIAKQPRLVRITGEAVSAVMPGPEGVRLMVAGRPVRARLLIAADGAQSTIRALLGVTAERFETGHAAIATVVETERPHLDTAWQCFLHDGPVALLPLPDRDGHHYCSVVWSQSRDRAEARMALGDVGFANALEAATEKRLGRIAAVDRRFCFPLEQQLAERFQPSPRVLLIGDAARVLHPLAGQGVNLGFEDVAGILDVVRRTGLAGLGEGEIWRAFVRRRRVRAEIMVRAMDAFRRVYGSADPTFQWLRNLGVDFVNSTPLIKTQLMRQALGLGF